VSLASISDFWSQIDWSDSHVRVTAAFLLTAALIFLSGKLPKRKGKDAAKNVPKHGGSLFGRFRHEQSIKVAGKRFDVAWRHIGIVGTTGSRKSTLLALLLIALKKRFVFVAGDHAPPLLNLTLSRGGIVWKPRGDVAWYPWGGDLELAVQRVEHMFPARGDDAGVHRSMFKSAARKAWGAVGERERDVSQVIAALPSAGASSKTMTENWSARLNELVESLGDSLKTGAQGGFDLCEALASGKDVGFALNSFADVSNRERFAKIAALEVLRAADQIGNLSVAFDEVGLLGAELFAESVRTLRVRLCTGLFASHIVKDFPEILRGLVAIWFFGQTPGTDKATRDWMAHATFDTVPPENFGEHALPLGKFYVSANGRVQTLTVPIWRNRVVPQVSELQDTITQTDLEDSGTMGDEPPDKRVYAYADVVTDDDGTQHWLWREGAPVNQTTGYPRLSIDGKQQYVHIVWWEKLHGPRPFGPDGNVMTVDHMCKHGKRCVSPWCKQLLTRGRNSAARWQRAKA